MTASVDEDVGQPERLPACGKRRRPVGIHGEVRLRVCRDHAVEHLGDDVAADLAEPVAVVAGRRFAQDVEPERRLALPAVAAESNSSSSSGSAPISRATASPDGSPVPCPRSRSRPASER